MPAATRIELLDRKEQLAQRAHAMLDEVQGDDRDFSTEEEKEYESLTCEIKKINRQLEGDALASAAPRIPAMDAPYVRDGGGRLIRGTDDRQGVIWSGGHPAKFTDLFPKTALDDDGFETFADFLKPLVHNLNDGRFRADVGGESSGVGGGYLVPTQHLAALLDMSLEDEIVRPRADVTPLKTNSAEVPYWDALDASSGSIGGFTGQWLKEQGDATNDAPKWGLINFVARKLAIYGASSNELVEDVANFSSIIEQAVRQAIGWHLDDAFLNGSGVQEPKGVFKSDSLIVVSKESGQASNTIQYANLTNMFSRLHPACVSRSVWLANPTTIPQLLTLFANNGSTSSLYPVLQQTSSGQWTMLTRPVLFSEKVPTLSSQGDISLVDFSKYAIGLRDVGTLESTRVGPGWTADETWFRLKIRVDANAKWAKAYTPKNGNTLSWAVTLEAR